MPGSGSNKRFGGTFYSVYEEAITINIIDTSYSGSANAMTIDKSHGGFELSYNTGDNDPYTRIDTMTATLTIKNDSSTIQEFFDDLLDSEEDRFYIQALDASSNPIFIGKIVPDDMTQADIHNPPIKLVAICSTTDLKNIDYDAPYTHKTIKDILLYCLNKLGTAGLYTTSETILMTQSNLTADVSETLTSIFSVMNVNNYFYKTENEIKKPLKCWDVVNELCGRLNCKFAYEHGRWNFTGFEGKFESRVGSYIFYAKNGKAISGTSPANTTVTLDDTNTFAAYGGNYRWQGAFNKVVLQINKDWTNKVYGDGDYYEVNYPGPEHAYYDLGYLISSEPYTLRLRNNIIFADPLTPAPLNFRVKYTVKITVISTSAETETEHEFEYPFNVAEYYHDLPIAGVSGDREIAVKAEIIEINPPGSALEALTCRFSYRLSKDKETDATEFKAYLDNPNVKTKTITNIASDRYGKDLVKFWFHSGTAGDPRSLTDDWKLNSADSYQSLELAIVSHMLKFLRVKQKYYGVNLLKKADLAISTSLYKYEYKSELYTMLSWKWNFLMGFCNVNLLKIPTGDSTGILTVEDVPAVNGNTSNFSNTITSISTILLEEFEGVTTNSVTLDYNIPDGTLQTSLKNNISVYVEGVRWKHITGTPTRKNTYSVNPTTNVITFFRALDTATVIVILNKIFVTGEAF